MAESPIVKPINGPIYLSPFQKITAFNLGGYTLDIDADVSDYNVYDKFIAKYEMEPPENVKLKVTVKAGILVWATNTATPAMRWGSAWTGTPIFNLVNKGFIFGAGGRGGYGADADHGQTQHSGQNGGQAMDFDGQTITIDNGEGYIFSGGSGGGGGGMDTFGRIGGGAGGGGAMWGEGGVGGYIGMTNWGTGGGSASLTVPGNPGTPGAPIPESAGPPFVPYGYGGAGGRGGVQGEPGEYGEEGGPSINGNTVRGPPGAVLYWKNQYDGGTAIFTSGYSPARLKNFNRAR